MVDILGERGWIYRKNHAILKDIAPVDAEKANVSDVCGCVR